MQRSEGLSHTIPFLPVFSHDPPEDGNIYITRPDRITGGLEITINMPPNPCGMGDPLGMG